ncbi:amidophosphoribosyltransferase [Granulicella cerasi]|uniref:Amidophosphoribosyltransferase n=1 Tax=Granulicella cerasi TaxID=741063 RepID=A0ABW1Z7B5_9BACT|nr:amidophosphoribosyltransferase [Granulicella cerasi]
MCGIVGVFGHRPVSQVIYDSLSMLQHRGQDAAGIATSFLNRFYLHKGNGLVTEVFDVASMAKLLGDMGIGHVRYPTAGCGSVAEAQPFYVNSPHGIVFAHNGNLTNVDEIIETVFEKDLRHLNTTSDSEVMLNVFAHALGKRDAIRPTPEDVFAAVEDTHSLCKGGYAVVAMISTVGIVAFRDLHGIRPLVYGQRTIHGRTDYMVASESVALQVDGFELVRDLEPGECLFIDIHGKLHTYKTKLPHTNAPCLFEFVYLARPDSVLDGASVYQCRINMGDKLADKILREWPDVKIDAVVPIPSTSRTSAIEIANRLGIPYREGFVRNRYVGRTFIMPGNEQRKASIRRKLNPIPQEFKDKNVLLVDDSIVRGNTIKEIIAMTRELGAKNVYVCSASPMVIYPNVYGIDMPSRAELVASGKTLDELAEEIGADKVIFQDLEDLKQSVTECAPHLTEFEGSVFDGHYITGDVTEEYLRALEKQRNDATKINEDVTSHITRNLAAHL